MKKIILLGAALLGCSLLNAQVNAVPYVEDFESYAPFAPPNNGWTGGFQVYLTHGVNSSKGLIKNLNNFATKDSSTTPEIGPLPANSQLKFDYRIVDFSLYPSTATQLVAGDLFEIQASVVGGGPFVPIYTVTSANHVPSTAFKTDSVFLTALTGSNIKLRFVAKRGVTGDYFIDIDNISVAGATEPFDTTSVTEKESIKLTILPNPNTNGSFALVHPKVCDVGNLTIYNLLGQDVYSRPLNINTTSTVINANLKAGVYVVKLTTKGFTATKRLVVE